MARAVKEIRMNYREIKYKGYPIMKDVILENGWTVLYCGDEIWFKTIEKAKAFIDEITEKH